MSRGRLRPQGDALALPKRSPPSEFRDGGEHGLHGLFLVHLKVDKR